MAGESPRQTVDRRTRLQITLMASVMIFVLSTVSRAIELRQRTMEAQQAAAQQRAQRFEENAEAVAAAKSLSSQTPDTTGIGFSPSAELVEHVVDGSLVFYTPCDWTEGVKNGSFLLFMSSGDSSTLLKAGIEYDLCRSCASDEEAIDKIKQIQDLDGYIFDEPARESGQMGEARWCRFPINNLDEDNFTVNYGYLEVVFSGRDAYWVKVFRNACKYNEQTHEEMLAVLNSIGGPTEAPLFGSAK